jgi:hypothetical protein
VACYPHPSATETEDGDLPAPGGAAPRWPHAPEPQTGDDGTVINAVETCNACDSPSTLTYRCSECGADLVTQGGSA